ncbi:MAG: DNA gyrase inhibitor YacG [Hyphomicrobiales bacterium]
MKAGTAGKAEEQKRGPCPICGKPSVERHAPFCSRRCGDVDLGRWLKGVYAIPVKEAEDDEEEEGARAADERDP